MTGMSEEQINHKLKPNRTTLNKLWLSEASSRATILFKQTNMTVREVNAVTLQYSDRPHSKGNKRETDDPKRKQAYLLINHGSRINEQRCLCKYPIIRPVGF